MNELNHPSEEQLNKGCLIPLLAVGIAVILAMLIIGFLNLISKPDNEESKPEPIAYRAVEMDGDRYLLPIYDYTNQ